MGAAGSWVRTWVLVQVFGNVEAEHTVSRSIKTGPQTRRLLSYKEDADEAVSMITFSLLMP